MCTLRWISMAAALLGAATIPAFPTTQALTGTFAIAGATANDPPPDEAQDTHLYLFLDGEAARQLYTAMKVEAETDVCLDDGSLSKRIGSTACIQHVGNEDYECTLGIAIATQRIDAGGGC
jgi:hypothetical protein